MDNKELNKQIADLFFDGQEFDYFTNYNLIIDKLMENFTVSVELSWHCDYIPQKVCTISYPSGFGFKREYVQNEVDETNETEQTWGEVVALATLEYLKVKGDKE